MASVNGYTRIRQLNRFLPTDVQVALFKNVGRNERVHVADFLLGDDYAKTESPYLPNGTACQIRELGGAMPHKKWCDKMREVLAKNENISNKDADFRRSFLTTEYVMRFVANYPIQATANHEHFINTVLNKCEDLMNVMASMDKEHDDQSKAQHRYKTRRTVAKIQELAERKVLCEKLRREVSHCQLVYWDMLDEIVRAKCEAVMRLSPNGIVFTCLPSP